MVDDKYNLKIIDFDTSTAKCGEDNCGLLNSYVGTKQYMAPEMLTNQFYSGEKVDMFALGTLLFMMVTGSAPFIEARPKDIRYKYIYRRKYAEFWAFDKNSTNTYSKEFKSLIEALLSPESEKRPTLTDLYSHPWLNTKNGAE